jgi:hypothetical protein
MLPGVLEGLNLNWPLKIQPRAFATAKRIPQNPPSLPGRDHDQVPINMSFLVLAAEVVQLHKPKNIIDADSAP